MARLPWKWREILDNVEFHRDSRHLRGAAGLPDEATMRLLVERLAARWEGRVHPSCPAGPLFQFGRRPKLAPGAMAVTVRRFEHGKFVVVVEIERADPDADNQTLQVELCSPPYLYDVLDVLLLDLEGAAAQRALPDGWEPIQLPGGAVGKFWGETERSWLSAPAVEGLAALPQVIREERAWRLLSRWVPGAIALFPCPCIQDLAKVFRGQVTCRDAAWAGIVDGPRTAALSRCTMAAQNCVSLQVWMLTAIAPVSPTTLLDTVSSQLLSIPEWVEARRGTEAALPTRLTLEGLTRATFHDVVGNPYRPVSPEPHWLSANDHAVDHLARLIDDHGEYNKLGLLGDALQDAGCDNQAVLDHCRDDGVHGPGCWVVDTLLGRMYTRS